MLLDLITQVNSENATVITAITNTQSTLKELSDTLLNDNVNIDDYIQIDSTIYRIGVFNFQGVSYNFPYPITIKQTYTS